MLKKLSLIKQRESGMSVDEYIRRQLKKQGFMWYESFSINDHDKVIIIKL